MVRDLQVVREERWERISIARGDGDVESCGVGGRGVGLDAAIARRDSLLSGGGGQLIQYKIVEACKCRGFVVRGEQFVPNRATIMSEGPVHQEGVLELTTAVAGRSALRPTYNESGRFERHDIVDAE